MGPPLDLNASLAVVPGGFGYTNSYLAWTDATGKTYWYYPDLVLSEQWTEATTATEHPVEQGANVIDHVRVELVKCALTIFATNEPIGANSWDSPKTGSVSISGGDSPAAGSSLPTSVTAQVWENELALKGAALAAGGVIGQKVGGVVGNAIGSAVGAVVGGLLQGHEVDREVSIYPSLAPAPTVTGTATVQQFASPSDFVQKTIDLFAMLKSAAQLITVNGSKQTVTPMVIEEFSYTREESDGTGATITLGLKEVRLVQTQVTTAPLPSMPSAATPVKKGTQNPSDGTAQQQQSVASTFAAGGASLMGQIASFFAGGG